ncbi:MAG TPA: histidine kinase [Actinomycetota bacterium]
MTEGRARALAGASLAISVLLSAGAAVALVLAWDVPLRQTEFGTKGYPIAWSLVITGVGALIAARRPSNPIGWILCALGVISGVLAFTSEYARWALLVEAGRPPGGLLAAWAVEWIWIPLIVGLGMVGAIFPDGRFLSAAWRVATWIAIAAACVPIALSALLPRLTIYEGFDNPVGIGGDGVADAAALSTVLLLPIVVIGAAAAVRRFRRSRGEERLRLKWLVFAMILVASMFGVYGVIVLVQGTATPAGEGFEWLEYLTILSFLAVPVSIAFGVLKYRLYDIDFVINKAVVYGAIAVFITAVYLVIVIGVGSLIGYASDPVLSAIAAATVALAFQPARRRAQHLANRLVYGKRATPYEVLSELSSRLAGAYSLEDTLPRLARVTAEAVGAVRATVWLRGSGSLRPAASWPGDDAVPAYPMRGDDLPPFGEREHGFTVRHRGDLLGAISAVMPPSEPLGPSQEKLLEDVAAQAGLVLRNVALLEDLRDSRKRIVTAADERARKLERNIHDGAQQQLVALTVKLRLARGLVPRDPDRAEAVLAELQTEAQTAIEDLRDLARGIYPPLLADKGLREAVEAQARKTHLPVRIDADGIGRYPQDLEAAVYFCTLEALQNVAKYAKASSVDVLLRDRGGDLTFEIRDDGVGFDVSAARGSGLSNMRDRLDALGGDLDVRSEPRLGTVVWGRVPLEMAGGA